MPGSQFEKLAWNHLTMSFLNRQTLCPSFVASPDPRAPSTAARRCFLSDPRWGLWDEFKVGYLEQIARLGL